MEHIDIARYLGAVSRTATSRNHEGRLARVVALTRTYDTTAADLWEAVTSAERLPRWFLPITGDLRLGGRYQLEGNAGGEILVCEQPHHLKVTWEFGGAISWVDVTIETVSAGSARLTLEHVAHDDERWAKFGPGAAGVGWDLALLGLGLHIESQGVFEASVGMTWMMSENGKAYVRQCSDDWGRAAIAGGEDPATATASAQRTAAFYTGS